MKNTSVIVMLSATLIATACNQSSKPESPSTTSEASVMVQGVNSGNLRSALLAVSQVEILADGREIASSLDNASADLARQGDKLSLRFGVPADARQIEVRISFDDFGGFDALSGEAGEIDARGTRIRFELPARDLAESGQAVVSLDLGRSLVERGPERALFLPNYQLAY